MAYFKDAYSEIEKCGESSKPEREASSSGMDVALISVQTRIPEFWTEMPRMWFAHFEAVMGPQKQSDNAKFEMAIAKLDRDALRQVSDLVQSPPATEKYNALKQRLLTVYEESAETQFQRLVSDMDLGTQKPSQLLRKMTELARNCGIEGGPLKKLWINRLSPSVRAVLAVSSNSNLEDLAAIADKILENLRSGEVASVNSSVHSSDSSLEMMKHMRDLTIEVKKLKEEVSSIRTSSRSQHRNYQVHKDQRRQSRSRDRGTSAPRRTPESADWLCHYHYCFRERARTCTAPCSWSHQQQKQQQQPGQGN